MEPVKNSITNQVQIIKPISIPTDGTYQIKFGINGTVDIPHNATVSDINNALDIAGLHELRAIDNMISADGLKITFTGAKANEKQPDVVVISKLKKGQAIAMGSLKHSIGDQIQIIKPVHTPTDGTYKIKFLAKETGDIAVNATTDDINKALDVAGLQDLRARTDMKSDDGLKITFEGEYKYKHQPNIIIISDLKKGQAITAMESLKPAIDAQKQTIKPINTPIDGTYRIRFDDKETKDIPFNATYFQINKALAAAQLSELKVLGKMNDPAGITISFTGSYEKSYQKDVEVKVDELNGKGGVPVTLKAIDNSIT